MAYDRTGHLTFKDKNFEESEYWYRKVIYYCVDPNSVKEMEKSFENWRLKQKYFWEYGEEDKKRYIRARCRRSIAQACKRLGLIYLEKNEPEKALSFLKKAQQLGANGIKRYLKKAEQFSKGRMEPDDILKLIPEPLTVEEMLKSATSRAEAIMGERYWTHVPGDWLPSKERFASAFLAAYKQPKSREEMKADLRRLVEVLGFIPPQSFMSIGQKSSLLKKLSTKKLKEIMPVMVEILPHEIYIKEFGSWLNALIESGVLSDGAKREIYGTRCLAKDGHECFSIAEKIVDDWLSANGFLT